MYGGMLQYQKNCCSSYRSFQWRFSATGSASIGRKRSYIGWKAGDCVAHNFLPHNERSSSQATSSVKSAGCDLMIQHSSGENQAKDCRTQYSPCIELVSTKCRALENQPGGDDFLPLRKSDVQLEPDKQEEHKIELSPDFQCLRTQPLLDLRPKIVLLFRSFHTFFGLSLTRMWEGVYGWKLCRNQFAAASLLIGLLSAVVLISGKSKTAPTVVGPVTAVACQVLNNTKVRSHRLPLVPTYSYFGGCRPLRTLIGDQTKSCTATTAKTQTQASTYESALENFQIQGLRDQLKLFRSSETVNQIRLMVCKGRAGVPGGIVNLTRTHQDFASSAALCAARAKSTRKAVTFAVVQSGTSSTCCSNFELSTYSPVQPRGPSFVKNVEPMTETEGYSSVAEPPSMGYDKASARAPGSLVVQVDSATGDEAHNLEEWLRTLRTDALQEGISAKTLQTALEGVLPLPKVVEKERTQPEAALTAQLYIQRMVTEYTIRKGVEALHANRQVLDQVEAKYGVPSNVLVALWGVESSYGKNGGNFDVVQALLTLARNSSERQSFFRKELLETLHILESGQGPHGGGRLRGSWAGAMGQCQFLPSSYRAYAVDLDGDGVADIWSSQADVFASMANYLVKNGWQPGAELGEKVTLPKGIKRSILGLKVKLPVAEWHKKLRLEGELGNLKLSPGALASVVRELNLERMVDMAQMTRKTN